MTIALQKYLGKLAGFFDGRQTFIVISPECPNKCLFTALEWELIAAGIANCATAPVCVDCATFNGTFTLAWSSNCLWKTSTTGPCGSGARWRMFLCEKNDGTVLFRLENAAGAVYELAEASFNCLGSNVFGLVCSGQCQDLPTTLTVTVKTDGTRRVIGKYVNDHSDGLPIFATARNDFEKPSVTSPFKLKRYFGKIVAAFQEKVVAAILGVRPDDCGEVACVEDCPPACCVPIITSVPPTGVHCDGTVLSYTPTLLDDECDPPFTWSVVSGFGSFTGGTYNVTCSGDACNSEVTIRVTNDCGESSAPQTFTICDGGP